MKRILYIILFIFPLAITAQKQAANWYFGQGAGLNFNSEPPTVLSDSKLFTFEGCATISDKTGQLLFYTDGITVYNKLHREMPNGLDLLGDPSSSQSAIIVPKPEDENIYYIFTVGAQFPGLRYSAVDMSLDDGNGDIIQDEKNIMLLSGAYEKITAVKHLDGSSIWVIGFDGGTFHAYRVSTSGINRTSVKSPLGEFIADQRGYLKASPNGEYIAMANHSSNSFLLSFFAASGRVFPGIKFEFENLGEWAYGVEFSAENKKLYVDTFLQVITDNPDVPENTRFLYQFDLSGRDIQSTRILIDKQEDTYRGALQLAINGKIYRALSKQYEVGTKYLGVINEPELDGILSNYEHNAINLSPLNYRVNLSTQGLPPFIQSLFFFNINVKNPCALQEAEFSLNTIEEDYTVVWNFGDGNTSNDINPTHQYVSAGFYSVTATMTLPSGETKTIDRKLQIFEVPLPYPILEQCDNNNDGFANFNLMELYDPWTKFDEINTLKFFETLVDLNNNVAIDASIPYINKTNPQQLWVKAVTNFGCELDIPFSIRAVNATLGAIEDIVVCDSSDGLPDDTYGLFNLLDKKNEIRNQFSLDSNIILTFYPTETDAEFESNPIEEDELISQSQTIWIRAETDTQSCRGIEPISLKVNLLPFASLSKTYYVCLNLPSIPVTIDAGSLYDSYEWTNIDNSIIFETSQVVNIFEPGNFSLTSYITENGVQCSRTELFSIEPSNIASFGEIIIVDASENNTITILATGEGIYEYALYDENDQLPYRAYQSSNVFENVFPGIYTIRVNDIKNDCGLITEQVFVIGFPKFFTPNNDSFHDKWQVYGILDILQSNSKIFIYNRYGKLIKQLDPLGEGWDGTFNGEMMPADDYWFAVTLQDGRVFKNHFTLKR